jgi:hypothetical protein
MAGTGRPTPGAGRGLRHRFTEQAIERAVTALRDFRAIALGAGAERILAVATAAMRDAENGPLLIERIRRETGIRIRVIPGDEEARYGFLGAVSGLPVSHGLAFDLGGGSMQVTRFRSRRLSLREPISRASPTDSSRATPPRPSPAHRITSPRARNPSGPTGRRPGGDRALGKQRSTAKRHYPSPFTAIRSRA